MTDVKKKDFPFTESLCMEMGGIEPPSEKVNQAHLRV